MFQPNQRVRFNVPRNEIDNQMSMGRPVVPNDCGLPNQMQQMRANMPLQNSNQSRNLPPIAHQHSVTFTDLSRPQMMGPPQDFPFIDAPPHFMGERPYITSQTGIHGHGAIGGMLGPQGQSRPHPDASPHMPPSHLQQINNFTHGSAVPMDLPFTDMHRAPQFNQFPYQSNENISIRSRQSFDYQQRTFPNSADGMSANFQASNSDGMMSNIPGRPDMESLNTDIENFSRVQNDEREDDFGEIDEEPKSTFDKYRREKDQYWVQNWLKRTGKLKQSNTGISLQKRSSDCTSHKHKMHEVQQAFHQSIIFLAKLQHQYRSLESMVTTVDPQVWEAEKNLTEEYRDKCTELHTYLNNEELLRDMKFKMEARRKKRVRLKKQRKEANEAREAAKERRENIHQQLEEWRCKMAQLAEDEKQKVELKKSADSTLSSVRKKIADAKRTQEFLRAIQKLRKVRRVTAVNQGRYASDAYDIHFEKKMEELTKLMTVQQAVYDVEEKTLNVMLEAVEEETRERDKEIKRQKERAKERLDKKLAEEKLFGKNVVISEDDELHPFHMYYRQAEHCIDALIQIRHEWDLHLVPPNVPGASRIPDGNVVPGEPSSDIWATALK